MANGVAFHSIEMDDVNNEASLHPGVVAFPTALSMADLAHVSGKDFITAVVAGYDLIVRLGRALQPAEHYGRGFHFPMFSHGLRPGGGSLRARLPPHRHLRGLRHGSGGCPTAGTAER